MRTRRTVLAALVVGLLLLGAVSAPSSARADSTSGVLSAATFQPAAPMTAGSGDSTTASLSFAYSSSSDTARSLSLTFAPGFLAAPAAVSATCSNVQLAAAACPAASEIGSGQATVGTIIGPQTATVSIFLTPPPGTGSVVGVGVVLKASVLGIPITTTTSGSAAFVTAAAGQPQLQITLPNLPSSVPVPVLGSVAIQLTRLTMTLDGSVDGHQFLYLPTSCARASTSIAVSTVDGASGTAAASFTPTGCPLAYSGGQVSASAQVVDSGQDAAFQTVLAFPRGASTTGVAIAIPNSALRANPIYAALNCPSSPPFTGCTQVGTVTAQTPLLSTALSGSAYLTGSAVGGYGIGLTFPAPFNITLSGSVTSAGGVTQVTFPSVPDLPLSSLSLSLTGSRTSAFQASCGAGTQTLIAALTGNGGAGTLNRSAVIAISGCPAVGANGGGSQVANYGNGATPTRHTRTKAPRITATLIGSVTTGHPGLRLSLRAGSARLTAVRVRLPSGLRFVSARLARTLRSSVPSTHRLAGGQLTVSFRRAVSAATLRVTSGGLHASSALVRRIRRHSMSKLTLKVVVAAQKTAPRTLSMRISASGARS